MTASGKLFGRPFGTYLFWGVGPGVKTPGYVLGYPSGIKLHILLHAPFLNPVKIRPAIERLAAWFNGDLKR